MPKPTLALLAMASLLASACHPVSPDAEGFPPIEERGALPGASSPAAPGAAIQLGIWTPETASPRWATQASDEAALLAECDHVDQGLMRVAARLAEHQAQGLEMSGTDEISFELRAAGVPHVWPRVWSLSGESSQQERSAGVGSWLRSFDDGGSRRCGVGSVGQVVAVVALDALADLEAVPRTARIGQWLDIRAHLLRPATEGKVVVLGPKGAPRSVSASLRGELLTARVVVDQPGPWLIQVLATLEGGPRPVAESMVFVEQAPPAVFSAAPVPGEDAAGVGDAGATTLAMLNAARSSEGLEPMRPHRALDEAAARHARAMMEARSVAHDVGLGGPADRVQGLGLQPTILGENVARGASVVLAHRALWASPSHRGNMLHDRFTDVGIGVAVDAQGAVWVCQLYAAFQ